MVFPWGPQTLKRIYIILAVFRFYTSALEIVVVLFREQWQGKHLVNTCSGPRFFPEYFQFAPVGWAEGYGTCRLHGSCLYEKVF